MLVWWISSEVKRRGPKGSKDNIRKVQTLRMLSFDPFASSLSIYWYIYWKHDTAGSPCESTGFFVLYNFPVLLHGLLAVNFKNVQATKIYSKAGFKTLEMPYFGGQTGPQYVMKLKIWGAWFLLAGSPCESTGFLCYIPFPCFCTGYLLSHC